MLCANSKTSDLKIELFYDIYYFLVFFLLSFEKLKDEWFSILIYILFSFFVAIL